MLCLECVEADEEISLSLPFEGLKPSRGPSKKLCQDMSSIENQPSRMRALHDCKREVHRNGIVGVLG